MLNGLLFVPESQRRALWSKCLLPAFPLFFFQMFKMPTDAQQPVLSRGSRHFKWMERSQSGGSQRRALNASQPRSPSSLSTFSRVLIGPKRWERRKKKKVSGILHKQLHVHSHARRYFILRELRARRRLRQQDQIPPHLDRRNDGKCQVWIQNNNQTSNNVGYSLTWMHSKGHK